MTLVSPEPAVELDDDAAIDELHRLYATQRAAYRSAPFPDVRTRKEHLGALAAMVIRHRLDIQAAMNADFAAHPTLFTDLVEVLGVAGRAGYAIEQLDGWLAADQRFTDAAVFGTAEATIRFQPKGVVGNIVPWNFPFDLSLGPLVEMLAAGNRVVIKPSDYTPACAELLRTMLRETFDEDLVGVSVGGLSLARAFATLSWDHLLYTGSPAIGRQVALAAAENLVPVTLELGGKCPALLTDDRVDAESVRNVIGTKLIKNGQMCISVDYALVPRDQLDTFVEHARHYVEAELPGYASSADCTGMITARHADRITDLVAEARASGARLIELGGAGEQTTRRLPLTLVVDPSPKLRIMQEEIFGPILPVVGYDSVDEAIDFVNAGHRPLGLYVFGRRPEVVNRVLERTSSGGACVNVCAVQGALPSLGFGGVGRSGTGRHHGVEGFREFSNPRGVVVRGTGDLADAFLPPYGPTAQAIADAAFTAAAG